MNKALRQAQGPVEYFATLNLTPHTSYPKTQNSPFSKTIKIQTCLTS